MVVYSVPSERLPRVFIMISNSVSQRCDWSCRQNQQMPHAGMNEATMRSPFFRPTTSLPASTIVPAPSWPEDRAGQDADVAVLQREVGVADAAGAELHDDVARPGGAGSMFSIESGPPVSVNTAARMGFLLDPAYGRLRPGLGADLG